MKIKRRRIYNFVPKKRHRAETIPEEIKSINYEERDKTKNFLYELEHYIKTDSLVDFVLKASKEEKGKLFVYDYFSILEEFNIKQGNYDKLQN